MRLRLFCLLALFVSTLEGSSPRREPITFAFTSDVGFGNSIFVVGNHPDLGAGDVTHAVKLRFTPGNVWTGQIGVQAGTQLQYQYVKRSTAQGSWCDPANATFLSGVLAQTVPAQPPAPYIGKTIYYLTTWSSANLFYRNGANFVTASMARIGSGRVAGESLFKINGLGQAGETIEFVFNDGNNHWDNPPGGGNYLTDLDDFEVEDGNVFSYEPPAAFSAPRIITHFVDSTATNIPGRTVRIYLPRGYDQNLTHRYPVIYLHDGQNVFDPGGPFGSWSADATATREMGQGRMREAILVGIDNDSARIPEYMPPNDSYQGTQGRADAYASFVINNVRPYLDNNFRTWNDAKNTVTIGSSLGGLVALYLGREFSTFGKIAVMSPALWISPNYVAQVGSTGKKPLRVHLDMGTAEGQSDFDNCLAMYDTHLAQGYTINSEVEFVAGCGQQHNEAAWSVRLPGVFDYLLPAREEPPELAQRDYPPRFAVTAVNPAGGSAAFDYTGLFGFTYSLDRSLNFGNWSPVSTTTPETDPWSIRTLNDSAVPAGSGTAFWRLRAIPAP
jgi:predicted alpha/beta superfamily hydrolase